MSRKAIRQLWRFLDGDFSEWLPVLVGVLGAIVLIWVVIRVRTWWQGDEDPEAADEQMLFQLDDLHREGDLTHDEYRSIKSQIIKRMEGAAQVAQLDVDSDDDDQTPSTHSM